MGTMLNDDYRLFRHNVTGKTGYYPAHFRDWPQFEEIDPATETCVDCVVSLPEPQEDTPVFLPPVVPNEDDYDDTEED